MSMIFQINNTLKFLQINSVYLFSWLQKIFHVKPTSKASCLPPFLPVKEAWPAF